jgi:hypothetical protein
MTGAWRQSGRISLWRYCENARNYSGWQINADAQGCTSLIDLLDALPQLPGGYRTLTIAAPKQEQLCVPNNKGGTAAWLAPDKLRICLVDAPSHWAFPADLQPACLQIGVDWLPRLREGIAEMGAGRGDYAVGPRGKRTEAIWFWWALRT